jgi:hypothetical protein
VVVAGEWVVDCSLEEGLIGLAVKVGESGIEAALSHVGQGGKT